MKGNTNAFGSSGGLEDHGYQKLDGTLDIYASNSSNPIKIGTIEDWLDSGVRSYIGSDNIVTVAQNNTDMVATPSGGVIRVNINTEQDSCNTAYFSATGLVTGTESFDIDEMTGIPQYTFTQTGSATYAAIIAAANRTYTAGIGISIINDEISSTGYATWGSVSGDINSQTDLQNSFVKKYSTMPEAVETLNNVIAQYAGETNANFTNGYFYKCIGETELVTDVTFTPNQGTQTVVTVDPEDFKTFMESLLDGADFTVQDVTHGSIGIYQTDPEVSYSFVPYTADGNFVYRVKTLQEFEEAGFTFSPVFGSQQGVTFTCLIDSPVTTYSWERVDTQPAGGSSGPAEELVNANTSDVSPLKVWTGTELEWEHAQVTNWRKWQTDGIASNGEINYQRHFRYGIGFDGEKFFGASLAVSPYQFATSTDGITWTYAGAMNQNLGNSNCNAIYHNGYYYMAGDYSVYRSSDGLSWTLLTPYIDYRVNPRYILATDDIILVTTNSANFFYSEDNGNMWTRGTLPQDPGTSSSVFVAYDGTKFVATSKDYVYISSDGKTWTAATPSFTRDATTRIVYGNGKFVSVSAGKYVAYSTDGENWTQVQDPIWSTYGTVTSLAFANGCFICVGEGGNIYYSPNGETWTQLIPYNQQYSASWTYDGVAAAGGNNKFIVTSTYSTGGTATIPVTSNTCYTTEAEPTTESGVYSEPNVASALTVTSVGTGTITLSDNNTYNRQISGDIETYQDMASLHPNYLCNIKGVGVKLGNAEIANNVDTSAFQTTANLVTSLSAQSTDLQYASAKCVYDLITSLQTQIGDLTTALHNINSGE